MINKPGKHYATPGEVVWETIRDAQEYLDIYGNGRKYVIYELDADWNLSTSPVADYVWRCLEISAIISEVSDQS